VTRTGLHISKLLKVVVDDDDDEKKKKKAKLQIFFFRRNFPQALFCSLKEIFSLEQYVEGFQKFHTQKKDVWPVSLRASSPGATLRYNLIKNQPISIHSLLGLRYSNF